MRSASGDWRAGSPVRDDRAPSGVREADQLDCFEARRRKRMGKLLGNFGLPAIPAGDLARIGVATTLIWGRHDRQVPLVTAETAATCFNWPLYVIENAGDDPALEQPEAFLNALHTALAIPTERGARA